MKLKDGVSLQGIHLEMREPLMAADRLWKRYDQELVITSGTESSSAHWAGSLHYYGYALDMRTRFFSEDEKIQVTKALKNTLGGRYTVLLEPTHIHVHYNLQG